MNMAQSMENAEVADDLIQGKPDEDGLKARRKEPQGKQFSAKGNVTSRLTLPPFKKKPSAGRQSQGFKRHFTGKTIEERKALRDAKKCHICEEEGHFANECPRRNSQNKDDKSDRKGKKLKPSAGLVPDLVGDQQNVDATELCRAWGKVRDQEGLVFFDPEARANFISSKLASKLGIRQRRWLGTGLGIYISRRNPSLMATFVVLSCGYLCCSYQEIKSVVLATLNRARFGVVVQSFLNSGQVPSISEGNRQESIFLFPWAKSKPIVLGARVNEAFESPYNFLDLLPLFKKENYLVAYSSGKRQTYVVLKESANSEDVLRATFHAQLVANILQRPLVWDSDSVGAQRKTLDCLSLFKSSCSSDMGVEAAIRESCNHVTELFEAFKHQANSQGWVMGESFLNPGIARLCSWKGA
ncbi:hypothetical protein L7F22_042406 [Adiantum nelumboides]|nr:hypothetical protein [Adiantum nelumboides]